MPELHLERLHTVLRGLAAGADPARLLHDALAGAIAATNGRDGLVMRATGEGGAVVSTSGEPMPVMRLAAQSAISAGRLVRKADAGVVVAAEPLRAGGKVVGAIAVSGSMQQLDVGGLPLYAEAAALVLARQAPSGVGGVPQVLDVISDLGAALDTGTVLGRIFDAAQTLFGCSVGFCALFDGGSVRVGLYRGLGHDQLLEAARHPDFKTLLTGSDVRVEPSSHPVVAMLARLGEVAVSLPLAADGRRIGQAILLLPTVPDQDQRALMAAFARYAAQCLRTADLYRQVGEHEEQLASMVHSMANPVVVVDEGGRLVEVNGSAASVFRLAQSFEIGQPVVGRLGHAKLEEMLASGEDGAAEVVVGEEAPRVYRATVRQLRSAEGRAMGRILVLDDLTSERELDAVKADFVAVIGHELRTPLTVMKGYIYTLTKRWESLADDKRGLALESLQSNVLRLERLIEDLLFMSSIEQRKFTLDLESVDLSAMVEDRASDRVVVRRPRRAVEVETDRIKVGQVLDHLLDNALKYSEGEVAVELTERDDVLEISVADSGPGIYSGDIPFLFERFRQLDGSSTRTHGGVGIGLYISKRIVDGMGGRINCESRLGIGTTFTFTLPKHGKSVRDLSAGGG